MKVLHITESLGAGVGHYVWLAMRAQAAAGHTVVLAHSIRHDTMTNLNESFAFLTKRVVVPMVTEVSVAKDAVSVWRLAALLRQEQPDIVHLHSSKAGVLGRVAVWLTDICLRRHTGVFYSPHGFAFLRQDVSTIKQKLYLGFERVAAMLGGTLVACSATEAKLASGQVGHPNVRLIENAIDLNEVLCSEGSADGRLNVLNAGRVCYQKAPWRFKAVAHRCSDMTARFVWLGDGDLACEFLAETAQVNTLANLKLTGWLSRAKLIEWLAKADIFLMPSLWEGMPLALIEAQAAGVPAVVSNVVGCRDVVQDGVTGFVCDTDEELFARTRQLIEDASLRKRMGINAARMARTRFSVARMNDDLLQLYVNTR